MKRILLSLALIAGLSASSSALPLGFGVGLHIGGAANKPSGLLVGADVTIPTLSLSRGLKTRLDFDTWGQPFSGWDSSSGGKAAAVCQVGGTLMGYVGAGIGYSRFRVEGVGYDGPELKLIGGVNLLGLGLEVNAHIGKMTVWTGMMRIRF
jgi:hypothetical protein